MPLINNSCADLLGHVQQLVQVHTSEGELPEGTLLLDFGIRLEEIKYSRLAPHRLAHTRYST